MPVRKPMSMVDRDWGTLASTFLPNWQVDIDYNGLVEFLGLGSGPTCSHNSGIDDARLLTPHPAGQSL
jgi:hypothetical protein